MKEYDVAVLYTDGSRTEKPQGAGGGIHGYLYNEKDFTAPVGFQLDGLSEAITRTEYSNSLALGDLPKLPEGAVEFVNCVIPVPKDQWSDVGELTAFISVFDGAPFKAKKYILHLDASYVLNAWEQWIVNWARKGWTKADGTPVGNLKLVQRMHAIMQELKATGRTAKCFKIKGHSGRYGNDRADQMARLGSTMSATVEAVEYAPLWTYDEGPRSEAEQQLSVDVGVPIAELPAISSQRFHYLQVNEPHPQVKLGDENWYYLLSGNHAKDKDDIVLLGKMVPEAMFSVTFARKPWENLYFIANAHAASAWEDTPQLKRYDPIAIINGEFLRRKKFVEAAKDGLPVARMAFSPDGNNWTFDPDGSPLIISRIIRPALLTYRGLEIRDELADLLRSAVLQQKDVVLNDITDKLFDEKGKPTKDFYRNVDRSFNIDVNIPGTDQTIPVIVTRGIDMPQRTEINRIKEPEGRFYIACWRPQERYVRYAVVYIGKAYHGLWIGYWSAKRILTDNIK